MTTPVVFGLYETINIGTGKSLRAVTFSREAAEQWVAENDSQKTWETRSYHQLAVWTGREEGGQPVSYREPTPQEIDELGLIKENGYTRCSDPQCGDSTWDHECDDEPQHRWKTRWVKEVKA